MGYVNIQKILECVTHLLLDMYAQIGFIKYNARVIYLSLKAIFCFLYCVSNSSFECIVNIDTSKMVEGACGLAEQSWTYKRFKSDSITQSAVLLSERLF